MAPRSLRALALLTCLGLGAVTATPWLCRRGGDAAWEGDVETHRALAAGVARFTDGELGREDFTTGSALFDGEWLFGTHMMAGMGFGQTALAHPALRDAHAPRVARAIDALLDPAVRAYDTERHGGEDALATLEAGEGHVAYLGYMGLVLGMHRLLEPDGRHAALHDQVAAALARRLARSPTGLVETYPGEVYPVDNLAAFGALGLHARATGADHDALLERFAARLRRDYVDPETGLLVQATTPDGRRADAPRGSGTALGAHFASFADAALSRELHDALRAELARHHFGFGTVREYPEGTAGRGDIDSGPIVLGAGLSATGFSLAGARIHGDEAHFRAVHATATLWGAPRRFGERAEWVAGGPLGNAILFAMVTARPAREAP